MPIVRMALLEHAEQTLAPSDDASRSSVSTADMAELRSALVDPADAPAAQQVLPIAQDDTGLWPSCVGGCCSMGADQQMANPLWCAVRHAARRATAWLKGWFHRRTGVEKDLQRVHRREGSRVVPVQSRRRTHKSALQSSSRLLAVLSALQPDAASSTAASVSDAGSVSSQRAPSGDAGCQAASDAHEQLSLRAAAQAARQAAHDAAVAHKRRQSQSA